MNQVADALTLIEAVGADNLGILFDTFHANIEEANMEASLRACGQVALPRPRRRFKSLGARRGPHRFRVA